MHARYLDPRNSVVLDTVMQMKHSAESLPSVTKIAIREVDIANLPKNSNRAWIWDSGIYTLIPLTNIQRTVVKIVG